LTQKERPDQGLEAAWKHKTRPKNLDGPPGWLLTAGRHALGEFIQPHAIELRADTFYDLRAVEREMLQIDGSCLEFTRSHGDFQSRDPS
jgi:hypothetical protein